MTAHAYGMADEELTQPLVRIGNDTFKQNKKIVQQEFQEDVQFGT